MDFIEAVTTCFKKSFTFSGRASRSEYWLFYLFTIIFNIITFVIEILAMTVGLSAEITQILCLLISLSVLPAYISVVVRRLHDVNRSGWWFWIPLTIIGIIPCLYWKIKRGTDGKNDYGNPPIK